MAGVAVDGGGQQVGLALVLQILHQLDVLFNDGDAGAGLHQGLAGGLGFQQLGAEAALRGDGLLIGDGLFQIHVLTGVPLGQNFLTQAGKFLIGNSFILKFHSFQAPFS